MNKTTHIKIKHIPGASEHVFKSYDIATGALQRPFKCIDRCVRPRFK